MGKLSEICSKLHANAAKLNFDDPNISDDEKIVSGLILLFGICEITKRKHELKWTSYECSCL